MHPKPLDYRKRDYPSFIVSLILENKVLATRDFVNLDKSEETAW